MLQKIDDKLLISRTGARLHLILGTILMAIATGGFAYFVNMIKNASTSSANPLVLKLQIGAVFALFFGLFFYFGCRLYVKGFKMRSLIKKKKYEVTTAMITSIQSTRKGDTMVEELVFEDRKEPVRMIPMDIRPAKGDICYLYTSIDDGEILGYFPIKGYYTDEIERPEQPTEVVIDDEKVKVGEQEAVEERARKQSMTFIAPCMFGAIGLGFLYGILLHTIGGAVFFGFAMLLVLLQVKADYTTWKIKRGIPVKAKALEVKKIGEFRKTTYEFEHEGETKVVTIEETGKRIVGHKYDAYYNLKKNELKVLLVDQGNRRLIYLTAVCVYFIGMIIQVVGF